MLFSTTTYVPIAAILLSKKEEEEDHCFGGGGGGLQRGRRAGKKAPQSAAGREVFFLASTKLGPLASSSRALVVANTHTTVSFLSATLGFFLEVHNNYFATPPPAAARAALRRVEERGGRQQHQEQNAAGAAAWVLINHRCRDDDDRCHPTCTSQDQIAAFRGALYPRISVGKPLLRSSRHHTLASHHARQLQAASTAPGDASCLDDTAAWCIARECPQQQAEYPSVRIQRDGSHKEARAEATGRGGGSRSCWCVFLMRACVDSAQQIHTFPQLNFHTLLRRSGRGRGPDHRRRYS